MIADDLLVVPLPAQSGVNHTALPTYNVLFTSSLKNVATTTPNILRSTSVKADLSEDHHTGSHVLAYSFICVGVLAFLGLVAFVAVCIFRRNKLGRIRHHLMPMYNFDATEEEARWEADLLEDDREQQIALNSVGGSSHSRPKLKFHSHGLDV